MASCVAVAVAGLSLAHRLIPVTVRRTNLVAVGAIYAAVYVMFGVTLGFSLLLVWQEYEAARQTAETEAAAVEEVYRLAGRFPEPESSRVRDAAVSYVRAVVEEEWPAMERGRSSPRAGSLADDLRESVQGLDPHTPAEEGIYSASLTNVDDLGEARVLRLLDIREGLPPLLWVVLVVGAAVTVSFTFPATVNRRNPSNPASDVPGRSAPSPPRRRDLAGRCMNLGGLLPTTHGPRRGGSNAPPPDCRQHRGRRNGCMRARLEPGLCAPSPSRRPWRPRTTG